MNWLWNAIFASFALSHLSVAMAAYTFEDLQALEQQKSYKEFIDHARDIRPSERNKLWSEMLSHMTTDYMVHLREKRDFDLATFAYVQSLTDWPELRADAFFHTKREAYILGYIENCYQKKFPTCRQNATEAWNMGRKNPDHGTLLAQVIVKFDPAVELTSFITPALKEDTAQFYCRKDYIQQWLLNKLAVSLLNTEDTVEVKKIFAEQVHESCLKGLKPILQQGLTAATHDMRHISYRLLKSFDVIDQSDEDLFLITYLLEGPAVGKTFNLAWATMRQISQDYKRRQGLLKRLAQLDPLPDGIFDSGNDLKRDTLTQFLAEHIPEYLTFYADTCVSYRTGKGEYPNGNPTLHCDKFFQLAKDKSWLSQEVRVQYAGTLKPN